jgi:hypothetical protein
MTLSLLFTRPFMYVMVQVRNTHTGPTFYHAVCICPVNLLLHWSCWKFKFHVSANLGQSKTGHLKMLCEATSQETF